MVYSSHKGGFKRKWTRDKVSMSLNAFSLILFLLTFPNMVSGTNSCDNPGGSWKPLGQDFYWFTDDKLSYKKSREECNKVPGGDLAEIMDEGTVLLFHDELSALGDGKSSH